MIRDVLWLTVGVGMLILLWQERQNSALSSKRADVALRALDDQGMEPNWLKDGRLLVRADETLPFKKPFVVKDNKVYVYYPRVENGSPP